MKRIFIIPSTLLIILCQTTPRTSSMLEEIAAPQKPPVFRYIAPPKGTPVVDSPHQESSPIAQLPQNAKVKVLHDFNNAPNGKSWTYIEFYKNGIYQKGWVVSEHLSENEVIITKEKNETTSLFIDKSIGKIVAVRGHFILAECVYSTNFSPTPYFFLGAQKQSFIFYEDNSFAFDVNNCSGTIKDEGFFSQKERIIRANVLGTYVTMELLNPTTLKITEGSPFLTCNVCREAYIVRQND